MAGDLIQTSSARIGCLCGAISEPGSLIREQHFPIATGVCNCSDCRTTSGALCLSIVALKSKPSDGALNACIKYAVSSFCERYSCGTCGSKVFFCHPEKPLWMAAASAIERTDAQTATVDTLKINYGIYCAGTRDGGIMARLMEMSQPEAAEITCYAQRFDSESTKLATASKLWLGDGTVEQDVQENSAITASCHCGGIRFQVLQAAGCTPNEYQSLFERFTREEKASGIPPVRKWVAKICTCRSCCLVQGTPLSTWSYPLAQCVLTEAGEPIDFGVHKDIRGTPGFETLRFYHKTPDAKRSFCGRCGAAVFYEHTSREALINVPTGILRDSRGSALVKNLLNWDWEWVSWPQESTNHSLLKAVTGGNLVKH